MKSEAELLKKNIKIVALDLDGTTFDSTGGISERTVKTLEDAAAAGAHIVVSTGRSYASLPKHIKDVAGIEYAITSNGAHVNRMHSGEPIYSEFLDPQAVERIAELKVETEADIEVFIDGKAYVDESYYEDVKENGCEFRKADYVLWSRRPVPDVTAALLWLTDKLGISTDELMCCGDAPNDQAMLELAGIGVAVANAWGGLKDHADYVTASNDDDGVALAIEKFVLNR